MRLPAPANGHDREFCVACFRGKPTAEEWESKPAGWGEWLCWGGTNCGDARRDRVEACLRACVGMKDPEAEIAQLKQDFAEVRAKCIEAACASCEQHTAQLCRECFRREMEQARMDRDKAEAERGTLRAEIARLREVLLRMEALYSQIGHAEEEPLRSVLAEARAVTGGKT